jgi:MFS family permease
MQAWLFTATYITILPTILSSGYLADRYGPKYVCLFALFLFVFSTITAPELAKWHYGALMADRSLIGMAEVSYRSFALVSFLKNWTKTENPTRLTKNPKRW